MGYTSSAFLDLPEYPGNMDCQIQDFLPRNDCLSGCFHISADFHGCLQFIGVLAANLFIELGVLFLLHTSF